MAATDSFADVMAGLSRGNEAAAELICRRFAGQMLELVRRRLSDRLRRKVDPEDVVQSVFSSFFVGHREGRFRIENWENLWGILAIITMRKCGRQIAHYQAERRDHRREEGLPTSVREDEPKLFAAGPSPSETYRLIELAEGLKQGLRPSDREVLTLYLQGRSTAEIADVTGRTMRTVRRSLERVKQRLRSPQ